MEVQTLLLSLRHWHTHLPTCLVEGWMPALRSLPQAETCFLTLRWGYNSRFGDLYALTPLPRMPTHCYILHLQKFSRSTMLCTVRYTTGFGTFDRRGTDATLLISDWKGVTLHSKHHKIQYRYTTGICFPLSWETVTWFSGINLWSTPMRVVALCSSQASWVSVFFMYFQVSTQNGISSGCLASWGGRSWRRQGELLLWKSLGLILCTYLLPSFAGQLIFQGHGQTRQQGDITSSRRHYRGQ